jgi:hypothetical protein
MLLELKFLIWINGCDCNNNIYVAKKRKQMQPKSERDYEFLMFSHLTYMKIVKFDILKIATVKIMCHPGSDAV